MPEAVIAEVSPEWDWAAGPSIAKADRVVATKKAENADPLQKFLIRRIVAAIERFCFRISLPR